MYFYILHYFVMDSGQIYSLAVIRKHYLALNAATDQSE